MTRPTDTTTPAPPAGEYVVRASGMVVPREYAGANDTGSAPALAVTREEFAVLRQEVRA